MGCEGRATAASRRTLTKRVLDGRFEQREALFKKKRRPNGEKRREFSFKLILLDS